MPNKTESPRFPAVSLAILLAAAILALAAAGGARAQTPVMTLVVAPTAAVFQEPSTGSARLGSIRAEDVVLVFGARGDWVKIEFQAANGEWTTGWVPRETLRLKKSVPEISGESGDSGGSDVSDIAGSAAGPGYTAGRMDTHENGYGAVYHLNLDHAALDCARDADVGFASCDVNVQTSMETTFNGAREPRLQFQCAAELAATDKAGDMRTYPADGRGEVTGRGGVGRIRMFADLYANVPVRHVRIAAVECRITGVIE